MEQSDHVEKKAICANSVYSLDDEIHSFHTRRGALITCQSLNPWSKGRSGAQRQAPNPDTDPDCHRKKRAKKHIQNQKKACCTKHMPKIRKRLQKNMQTLRNRCASSMQNVCKWYTKDMFVPCFCMFFLGGDLGQYLGWSVKV